MNGWLGGISRKGRLRSFATLTQRGCCFPGASRVKGSVAEGVCEPLQLYTEGGEGAAVAAGRSGWPGEFGNKKSHHQKMVAL